MGSRCLRTPLGLALRPPLPVPGPPRGRLGLAWFPGVFQETPLASPCQHPDGGHQRRMPPVRAQALPFQVCAPRPPRGASSIVSAGEAAFWKELAVQRGPELRPCEGGAGSAGKPAPVRPGHQGSRLGRTGCSSQPVWLVGSEVWWLLLGTCYSNSVHVGGRGDPWALASCL